MAKVQQGERVVLGTQEDSGVKDLILFNVRAEEVSQER